MDALGRVQKFKDRALKKQPPKAKKVRAKKEQKTK